jgi:ATP-dependent DNA helicase RecG
VKPSITPVVKFAMESEHVVLVIEVPRGRQPIYYNKNTSYIRHLSRSRPAEPHEVIECVEEWLGAQPGTDSAGDEKQQFFSSLASMLIDVLVQGEELEGRSINPWFDMVRLQLGSLSEGLRQLAASKHTSDESIEAALREIADLLDRAVAHRMAIGRDSWQTLSGYVKNAIEKASALKAERIDRVPLSATSQIQVREVVAKTARELADLDRRAEGLANEGRMEQLQSEASRLGHLLLRLSYYQLEFISPDFPRQLRSIARALHLLETQRLYIDGGASMRRVVETLHDLTNQLQQLVTRVGL